METITNKSTHVIDNGDDDDDDDDDDGDDDDDVDDDEGNNYKCIVSHKYVVKLIKHVTNMF